MMMKSRLHFFPDGIGVRSLLLSVLFIMVSIVLVAVRAAQTPSKPAPPPTSVHSVPLTETQRLRYQVLYLSVCSEARIPGPVCAIDWTKGTVSDMTPAPDPPAKPQPTQ